MRSLSLEGIAEQATDRHREDEHAPQEIAQNSSHRLTSNQSGPQSSATRPLRAWRAARCRRGAERFPAGCLNPRIGLPLRSPRLLGATRCHRAPYRQDAGRRLPGTRLDMKKTAMGWQRCPDAFDEVLALRRCSRGVADVARSVRRRLVGPDRARLDAPRELPPLQDVARRRSVRSKVSRVPVLPSDFQPPALPAPASLP
jgi:hypothetical protein